MRILSLLCWFCLSAMATATLIDSNLTTPGYPLQAEVFERNGVLYGFFQDGVTIESSFWPNDKFQLECWKSTDNGANWAEVDAANHKHLGKTDAYVGFDRDGDTVWVLWERAQSSNRLFVSSFDLSTEAWGSDSTTMGAPTPKGASTGRHGKIVKRPSDVLIAYQGDNEINYPSPGDARERIYWQTYDPGADTWGTASMIGQSAFDEDHRLAGMVIDQDNRTHIWIAAETYPAAAPAPLRHLSIDSDDTENSTVLVGTVLRYSQLLMAVSCGGPLYFQDGGVDKVAIPYCQLVGGVEGLGIAIGDASAAPTWALDTIDTTQEPETSYSPWPIASSPFVADGVLNIIWFSGSDLDVNRKIWRSTLSGGSWSAPEEIHSETFYFGDIYAVSLSMGIGIAFTDGSGSFPWEVYWILLTGGPLAYFGVGVAVGNAGANAYGIFV